MVARNRVVFNGTLGDAGQEVWSTGISFAGATPGALVETQEDLQTWANAIKADWLPLTFPTLFDVLGSGGFAGVVRTEVYGSDNALVRAAESAAIPVEGTSPLNCPAQTSVVCSLLTGISGRSFRGRSYWPALGLEITTDLVIGTGNAPAEIAADFSGLLTMVADNAPGIEPTGPVVYSTVLDLVTPVTSISVGNVPDTQRRRRDNLQEVYSTVPWPQA